MPLWITLGVAYAVIGIAYAAWQRCFAEHTMPPPYWTYVICAVFWPVAVVIDIAIRSQPPETLRED